MNIDWDEIRKRLAAAQAAVEQGSTGSPEHRRRILRARAQALAQEIDSGDHAGESIEILEFRLAYETYAVETQYIREVSPLQALTPLPGAPAFIAGIINARGQVISVVDIKSFFGLPDKGLGDLNRVIVLRHDGVAFGILADAIVGIRAISSEELQPSLPTLTGVREEYLKGIGRGPLIVLDAAKLISDKALIVRGQA